MHPSATTTSAVVPFAALQAEILRDPTPLRAAVTAAYRRNEVEAVQWLLGQLKQDGAGSNQQAQALAHKLVASVREKRTRASGVDALMHEFSLSSLSLIHI